jgi:hypothetical protein
MSLASPSRPNITEAKNEAVPEKASGLAALSVPSMVRASFLDRCYQAFIAIAAAWIWLTRCQDNLRPSIIFSLRQQNREAGLDICCSSGYSCQQSQEHLQNLQKMRGPVA